MDLHQPGHNSESPSLVSHAGEIVEPGLKMCTDQENWNKFELDDIPSLWGVADYSPRLLEAKQVDSILVSNTDKLWVIDAFEHYMCCEAAILYCK